MMLTQRSKVRKCFIKSKTEAYIQEKIGWSDQRNGSRILRGGASHLRIGSITLNGRSTSSEVLWKHFGAKRRGLLKVKVFWRQKARVIKVIKISGMIYWLRICRSISEWSNFRCYLSWQEPYSQHFIFFVPYEWARQDRVFVPSKPFQPCVI